MEGGKKREAPKLHKHSLRTAPTDTHLPRPTLSRQDDRRLHYAPPPYLFPPPPYLPHITQPPPLPNNLSAAPSETPSPGWLTDTMGVATPPFLPLT